MQWKELADALFVSHDVRQQGLVLSGTGHLPDRELAVVGTTDHAEIGVALALAQARVILDVVRRHPGRAILMLIDTQGQRLRHHDELLGIHRAMAHLGQVVDFARRQGHRVIGLVYDQALSGGFITSGLVADACDALPEAEIRVMRIPAMSRVTKIPKDRLEALSRDNPVFAPGVANYVAMGGVRALWQGDLSRALGQALDDTGTEDVRARDGRSRGGRLLAADVVERVLAA